MPTIDVIGNFMQGAGLGLQRRDQDARMQIAAREQALRERQFDYSRYLGGPQTGMDSFYQQMVPAPPATIDQTTSEPAPVMADIYRRYAQAEPPVVSGPPTPFRFGRQGQPQMPQGNPVQVPQNTTTTTAPNPAYAQYQDVVRQIGSMPWEAQHQILSFALEQQHLANQRAILDSNYGPGGYRDRAATTAELRAGAGIIQRDRRLNQLDEALSSQEDYRAASGQRRDRRLDQIDSAMEQQRQARVAQQADRERRFQDERVRLGFKAGTPEDDDVAEAQIDYADTRDYLHQAAARLDGAQKLFAADPERQRAQQLYDQALENHVSAANTLKRLKGTAGNARRGMLDASGVDGTVVGAEHESIIPGKTPRGRIGAGNQAGRDTAGGLDNDLMEQLIATNPGATPEQLAAEYRKRKGGRP